MGKETERTFCNYIQDGVSWIWRTRPSRRRADMEERECVVSCTGNDYCAKKQKGGWKGKGLEGAKPKNDCPICKENITCEMTCY